MRGVDNLSDDFRVGHRNLKMLAGQKRCGARQMIRASDLVFPLQEVGVRIAVAKSETGQCIAALDDFHNYDGLRKGLRGVVLLNGMSQ